MAGVKDCTRSGSGPSTSGAGDSGTRSGADEHFERYRATGDRRLREELIQDHLGLARALAYRYADRGEPLDDLHQVAALGLIKAVERFDPGRGCAFSSYAVPTILGELRRHFRDHGWAMSVPRRLKRVSRQLSDVTDRLRQELGRTPTIDEIAAELGERPSDVLAALEARRAYRPDSIFEDGGRRSVAERLSEEGEGVTEGVERAMQIEQLLAGVEERERRILVLRFRDELTQAEIAERVGVSQMHVSRLLRRSLDRLREADAQAR